MPKHENIIAWKVSYTLSLAIYQLTKAFPSDERYGLISQMRRASISIPSNIAEGFYRQTRKEYKHFCYIANGSAGELQTQIRLSKDLQMAPIASFAEVDCLMDRTKRLISKLSMSL
jgi:four helix bundle protein